MNRIILASGSHARQNMLRNAGVDFTVIPADIDEAAISKDTENAEQTAIILAQQKARHISQQDEKALVVGSDQVLECNGQIMSKALNKQAAIEKLKMLQGCSHKLISAVSVAQNNETLWSYTDTTIMTMHSLSDDVIERYAEVAGDPLTSCVGAYAYEAHGAWLFEKTEGEYFTILGMPLLPLLTYLRDHHGGMP